MIQITAAIPTSRYAPTLDTIRELDRVDVLEGGMTEGKGETGVRLIAIYRKDADAARAAIEKAGGRIIVR